MANAAEIPVLTRPHDPMGNFSVGDVVKEMEAACSDASSFLSVMRNNERVRLAWWDYKDTRTGKKLTQKGYEAVPFNGAADHEVYLTQAVLNKRNALRMAALGGGALSVTPTESGDTAGAARMRNVLRYFLTGPMRGEFLTQTVRAGSYADRYRFSLLYVGWKEERGVERVRVTREMVAGWLEQEAAVRAAAEAGVEADGVREVDGGVDALVKVMDEGAVDEVVGVMLKFLPGLGARGAVGRKEAVRALRELRGGAVEAVVHGSYVRRSCPCLEACEPFVDVLLPAETWNEPTLDSCRWVARVRWRSAQWIREQAKIHDWDEKWVKVVLEKHKGRSRGFNKRLGASWALGGGAVGWSDRVSNEAQNHLYQIVELWDRSLTEDGLVGTYKTVMHADVPDRVAKRELREDWDGMYPFVPFTFSMDEKLLLGGLSVPEVTRTAQHALKAQYDSRTDAAALTTYPTWTGDPELAGMRISPGKFLPAMRGKLPEALKIPPPDGRSVEVEKSLRLYVDDFFGFAGDAVGDAMAMSMGQAMVDWFMEGVSLAVARCGRLIQQYMNPLLGARIAGTDEVVEATAEDVRGSFDYAVRYDVKASDVKWVKEHLGMIKEFVLPLDQGGYVNTLPMLESAFNLVDPGLAARSLPMDAVTMERRTVDEARAAVAQIFTGSPLPNITRGMNFAGLAEAARAEVMNSPARMEAVVGGSQLHAVLTAYMEGLVNNAVQHGGENARVGRTLQEDPLKELSEAERFTRLLGSLPDGVRLLDWVMRGGEGEEAI